jgi:hypothetical protein
MDDGHSLEARQGITVVFASSGKWLHPLLDLEQHLARTGLDPAPLALRDKIVGKAAALLIVRMGIRTLHAGILSRLGESALRAHGVRVTWDALVDHIDCRTEELLADVHDPDEAHALIVERARSAREAGAGAAAGRPA